MHDDTSTVVLVSNFVLCGAVVNQQLHCPSSIIWRSIQIPHKPTCPRVSHTAISMAYDVNQRFQKAQHPGHSNSPVQVSLPTLNQTCFLQLGFQLLVLMATVKIVNLFEIHRVAIHDRHLQALPAVFARTSEAQRWLQDHVSPAVHSERASCEKSRFLCRLLAAQTPSDAVAS